MMLTAMVRPGCSGLHPGFIQDKQPSEEGGSLHNHPGESVPLLAWPSNGKAFLQPRNAQVHLPSSPSQAPKAAIRCSPSQPFLRLNHTWPLSLHSQDKCSSPSNLSDPLPNLLQFVYVFPILGLGAQNKTQYLSAV